MSSDKHADGALQRLGSRFCPHDDGGISEEEFERAVVQLHDFVDVSFKEMSWCFRASQQELEEIYEEHPWVVENGGAPGAE